MLVLLLKLEVKFMNLIDSLDSSLVTDCATTNVVHINITTDSLKYKIDIDSKVTYIYGFSGTGKTTIWETLQRFGDNDDNLRELGVSVECSDGYTLMPLPMTLTIPVDFTSPEYLSLSKSDKRALNRTLTRNILDTLSTYTYRYKDKTKVILFGDEILEYINLRCFQKAINESPYLFIFANRNPLGSVPASCRSVKHLVHDKGVNMFTTPYSGLYNITRDTYSSVWFEDSASGLNLFKKIGFDNIRSFGGMDNLRMYISNLQDDLIVLDGLGAAHCISDYVSMLKGTSNDIYLIGSFEHMLLTSEFAKRGNVKSGFVLREPAINEWNVEEFYAKELSRFCVEALKMRRGYHKQDLANCFTEACKSSVKDCKGLLDLTQSSCDYRIPGTLQDKFKTLVPADLYQVLINLKGDSKLTCNQSQVKQSQSHDDAKLSDQLDTNSDKTDSKESESDITTNLFGC